MRKGMIALSIGVAIATLCIAGFLVKGKQKTFPKNSRGSNINVSSKELPGHLYKFSTYVRLGEEMPASSGILEVDCVTKIGFDEQSNKYFLIEPRLTINPIGCKVDSQGKIEISSSRYTTYYNINVEPNENFEQSMSVKSAKALLESKNIKIEEISRSYGTKIKTVGKLKSAENPEDIIRVKYRNLGQVFNGTYQVRFDLISDKEGTFYIF